MTQTIASRAPDTRDGITRTVLWLFGLGLGISLGLPFVDGTLTETHQSWLLFLGSLTGLVGTYCLMSLILLASRLHFLEHHIGHLELLRWHRHLAPFAISLIVAHILFVILGDAAISRTSPLHQVGVIVGTYPGMIAATVAFAIVLAVATTSVKGFRQRIPRQYWWSIHLLVYLAAFLSLAHVLALGPSLVGHQLVADIWMAAWVTLAGFVLFFRFGQGVFRSLRHQLRVAAIIQETPHTFSLILRGRHLNKLPLSPGQFCEWRFLARGFFFEAHPFTPSAAVTRNRLRLTIQSAGDMTSRIHQLPIGTRVALEGPYGIFRSTSKRPTLILAGGSGATAARALCEGLTVENRPIVILRTHSHNDALFTEEFQELCAQRDGTFVLLAGSRSQVSLGSTLEVMKDLRFREVFVCGSPSFVDSVARTLRWFGITSFHHEGYSLHGKGY